MKKYKYLVSYNCIYGVESTKIEYFENIIFAEWFYQEIKTNKLVRNANFLEIK